MNEEKKISNEATSRSEQDRKESREGNESVLDAFLQGNKSRQNGETSQSNKTSQVSGPKEKGSISIKNVIIGVLVGLFVMKVVLDHWTINGFK